MTIDEKALEDASRAYCDVIRLNYDGLPAQLAATRDQAMRRAISTYLESAKQKEAEGWVLVPKEPTEEMIAAAMAHTPIVVGPYLAMLAAAPEPPSALLSAGGENG